MLHFEKKCTIDSEHYTLPRYPQRQILHFFLGYKPVTNAQGCENTVSVFLLAQS